MEDLQISTNDHLEQAVLSEVKWESSVLAAHIGVGAKSGVVTLSGHVETYAAKHAAETAARRVRSVMPVPEGIEVRLPSEISRADAIAAAAPERLAWEVSVPQAAVTVGVEKGWVTLIGQVDWWFQQDARRLCGATGLSNEIMIKPTVDAAGLSDEIKHALRACTGELL